MYTLASNMSKSVCITTRIFTLSKSPVQFQFLQFYLFLCVCVCVQFLQLTTCLDLCVSTITVKILHDSSTTKILLLQPCLHFPLSSFLMFISLIYFSCSIAVARVSSTTLNKCNESSHSCLILDLSGKKFRLSLLSIFFGVFFFYSCSLSN